MKNTKPYLLWMMLVVPFCLTAQSKKLSNKAEKALEKGVAFFHTLNTHGGYVYYVTPDLSRRWGEGPKDEHTIEVQPPGTPAVGQSFLNAYKATGDKNALNAALDAAHALVDGQNKYGGWDHTINFANISHDKISLDDNQTQSAVSFLMALDQEVDDEKLSSGVEKALKMMSTTQLKSGAWPHFYPEQGNYHDYATFNDGGINDCIRVMIEAYKYYGDNPDVVKTIKKAARFMNISQLPPPQAGWAQQYNEYLQPAWARTFEPPAVCPLITALNINTIIDLYIALEDRTVLEPIPDAIRWLNDTKMDNGLWGRFIEIGTGKALYYDRPRIRVNTLEDLHPERRTGYRYEIDVQDILDAGTERYQKAHELSLQDFKKYDSKELSKAQIKERLKSLEPSINEILNAQNSNGAWITKNDKFKAHIPRTRTTRWNGEYETMDRISSEVFNENVATLCQYIQLSEKLSK